MNNTTINWLKTNWFLFIALISAGIAWGQTTAKVTELEAKLNSSVIKQQKIETISESQSRLDERTANIQKEQQDQKQLLLEILRGQKSISNSITKN
jgi:hypothetical protein